MCKKEKMEQYSLNTLARIQFKFATTNILLLNILLRSHKYKLFIFN